MSLCKERNTYHLNLVVDKDGIKNLGHLVMVKALCSLHLFDTDGWLG